MTAIERRGSPRILRGTQATLEVTFYNNGTATNSSTTPKVTVTKADGTVLVDGEDATALGGAGNDGVYQYGLSPAQTADVDFLTAVWTATIDSVEQSVTTHVEIVGELLFTEAEARAFDASAMSSTTTYTDRDIQSARDRIAEAFEEITGISFGTRYGRDAEGGRRVLDGNGKRSLWLPDLHITEIRAVATRAYGSQTWTAFSADDLVDILLGQSGELIRESRGVWSSGRQNIRIEYEYGLQPIPYEIKRAALLVLRYQLVASNLPRNAIQQLDELGTFQLASAGRLPNPWSVMPFFGIPEVDEVLHRYNRKIPAVA